MKQFVSSPFKETKFFLFFIFHVEAEFHVLVVPSFFDALYDRGECMCTYVFEFNAENKNHVTLSIGLLTFFYFIPYV